MQRKVYILGTSCPGDHSFDNLNTSKFSTYCEFTRIVHPFAQLKVCRNTCYLSQFTVETIVSSMPSTKKQEAKDRRSRQMVVDLMSNVENVDFMLGSYSRDDEVNNGSENEANLDSGSTRSTQGKFKCNRRRLQIITQY